MYGDHLLHCKDVVSLRNAPLVWRHDVQLRFLAGDLRRVTRDPQIEYCAPISHKSGPELKCIGEQGGVDYIEMSIVHSLSRQERMRITRNKPTVSLSILDTRKIKTTLRTTRGCSLWSKATRVLDDYNWRLG